MVRLTLGVFFILDYEYMGSETETQEKSHFHLTSRIPNSSLLFAAALSQNCRIVVQWRRKCIFETPHN